MNAERELNQEQQTLSVNIPNIRKVLRLKGDAPEHILSHSHQRK